MTGARWVVPFSRFVRQFPEFLAPSWLGWRSIAAAMFGEIPEDVDFVHRVTGRTVLPGQPVRALFAAAGRGSGKTRFPAGLMAVYFAVGREYDLAPGEQVYITIFSPSKRQSLIAFRYILGLLKASFADLITRETDDTIELASGVVVNIGTADYRTGRGGSLVYAIVDEGAFLPTDDSATPDTELLRALRPALARVPGSMLLFVSSPYAQRGELYKAFQKHFGQDESRSTLVVRATTLELNPTFDASAIAEAFDDDPVSADAEYNAQFRRDVESFLSPDAIAAVVVPGRLELAPQAGVFYRGFLDFAGGSAGKDSATLGIAHSADGREILDAVREARPPFSPETICAEFAVVCASYGVSEVPADRWGGQFPVEQMAKHGVTVHVAKKTKSELYRDLLPIVNSGRCELLDLPRLRAQLMGLERRTARGGRDSIDHGPGSHDDVANAVSGVLTMGSANPWLEYARQVVAEARADAS